MTAAREITDEYLAGLILGNAPFGLSLTQDLARALRDARAEIKRLSEGEEAGRLTYEDSQKLGRAGAYLQSFSRAHGTSEAEDHLQAVYNIVRRLEAPDTLAERRAYATKHVDPAPALRAKLAEIAAIAEERQVADPMSGAQGAAARIIDGFVPATLADRLTRKADDLRKTIEHAKINDSGWCDTAPLTQWEADLADLEHAASCVQTLQRIAAIARGEG